MKINIYALLITASLFLTAGGCSKHKNRDNVPDAVIVQFDQDHKKADNVYWEPSESGFRASFKDGGIEKVAIYSSAAKPVRVEYVVQEKEVPVVVVTNLRKKYPKAEIQHITFIEAPGRQPYYVVRTKDSRAINNIEISLKGIVIRRVLVENLLVVKSHPSNNGNGHGHGHGHHKHKHKKGHGHGNCKHDDHSPGIVIRL